MRRKSDAPLAPRRYRDTGVDDSTTLEYWGVPPPPPHSALPVQDAGVKAMVSGMISASSAFLLASSFNGSGSNECQKPHSKYIDLVAEWRLDVVGKNLSSFGQMLPTPTERGEGLRLVWYVVGLAAVVMLVGAWAQKADVVGRPQSKKLP